MRKKRLKSLLSHFKKLKFIILLVLIIIGIFFIKSLSIKKDIERKTDLVSDKLVTISELATSRYDYSNVIAIKNNLKYKDFNIPFTEKSFVIKYTGHITAGIDLTTATFSINKNTLSINVPSCTVLNNTIDEDEIFIFDEKTSIFNKLTMEEMLDEILSDKETIEENLLKDGFLQQVNEETTKLLKDLFFNCGFDNVIISIQWIYTFQ